MSFLPTPTKAKAARLLNFPHFTARTVCGIFLVEKVKSSIYLIIKWWRETTKNTQEFELAANLSQETAAKNCNVILVTRKREAKNLSPPELVEPLNILRGMLTNLFAHLQDHHGRIIRVLLVSARRMNENTFFSVGRCCLKIKKGCFVR